MMQDLLIGVNYFLLICTAAGASSPVTVSNLPVTSLHIRYPAPPLLSRTLRSVP
jgi:hypothetical protein